MYCSNCGAQNQPGGNFCQRCGQSLTQPVYQQPVQPQPTAALPTKKSRKGLIFGLLSGVLACGIVGLLFWMTVIPAPVVPRTSTLPEPIVYTINQLYVLQQNLDTPEQVEQAVAEGRGDAPSQTLVHIDESPFDQSGNLVKDGNQARAITYVSRDGVIESNACGPDAKFVIKGHGIKEQKQGIAGLLNTGRYVYTLENIGESIADSEYSYWAVWYLSIGQEKLSATTKTDLCIHNGDESLTCYGPDLTHFTHAEVAIFYGDRDCPFPISTIPVDTKTYKPLDADDSYCYPEGFFEFVGLTQPPAEPGYPFLEELYRFSWEGEGEINPDNLWLFSLYRDPTDDTITVKDGFFCWVEGGYLTCPNYSLNFFDAAPKDFSLPFELYFTPPGGGCDYPITTFTLNQEGNLLAGQPPQAEDENESLLASKCDQLDFSGVREELVLVGADEDAYFYQATFSFEKAPDLSPVEDFVGKYVISYSMGDFEEIHTCDYENTYVTCDQTRTTEPEVDYMLSYQYGTEFNPNLYSCAVMLGNLKSDFPLPEQVDDEPRGEFLTCDDFNFSSVRFDEFSPNWVGGELVPEVAFSTSNLSLAKDGWFELWVAYDSPTPSFDDIFTCEEGNNGGSLNCPTWSDIYSITTRRLKLVYLPEDAAGTLECTAYDDSFITPPTVKINIPKSCYVSADTNSSVIADLPAGSVLPVVSQTTGGYYMQVYANTYTGPGECWVWVTDSVVLQGSLNGVPSVAPPPPQTSSGGDESGDSGSNSGGSSSSSSAPAPPIGLSISGSGDSYTLKWQAAANATNYKVDLVSCQLDETDAPEGVEYGGSYTPPSSMNETSYNISGTSISFEHVSYCGKNPNAAVKACNSNGCSDWAYP